MKIPYINWIPFDKDNPPSIPVSVYGEPHYLIFFREKRETACDYDDSWWYHVDVATPNGHYLGNFWDTEDDWDEDQTIEVLAYAEKPTYISEYNLLEDSNG